MTSKLCVPSVRRVRSAQVGLSVGLDDDGGVVRRRRSPFIVVGGVVDFEPVERAHLEGEVVDANFVVSRDDAADVSGGILPRRFTAKMTHALTKTLPQKPCNPESGFITFITGRYQCDQIGQFIGLWATL